jgi:hypothetical protein
MNPDSDRPLWAFLLLAFCLWLAAILAWLARG